MPGSAEFHHNEAQRLADIAESSITLAIDEGATAERMEAVGRIANAAATLALAHRTAEQTALTPDPAAVMALYEETAANISTTIWEASRR